MGNKRKVLNAYEVVYPDAIVAKKGDRVLIQKRETNPAWLGWVCCVLENGKAGWISDSYLQISDGTTLLTKDYDAREVALVENEFVEILNIENGWAWVRKDGGAEGWVPFENLGK